MKSKKFSLKSQFASTPLKAILFDLDGVLVDTMKYHDAAWREAIAAYGLEVSSEEIYLREGEKGANTANDLLSKAGQKPHPDTIQDLIKHKEKIFKGYPKAQFFPGASEIVKSLYHQNYLLALVTGSFLAEVKAMMTEDFLSFFKVIVTGDSVLHGKPHPEPYLTALKGLKIEPFEALVIENAPYGIRSAKAAGVTCIAVETSLSKKYLSEADLVLESLEQVGSFFREL